MMPSLIIFTFTVILLTLGAALLNQLGVGQTMFESGLYIVIGSLLLILAVSTFSNHSS